MITCCELALWIALGAFTLILALLAMFFNYNLKLDARTVKLEKKNGHELDLIAKLKTKDEQKQRQIDELKKQVAQLELGGDKN